MSQRPAGRPRLIYLTILAEQQLRRWINRRGKERGVSAAVGGVLLQLAGHPNATVGEVTPALRASAAGASGLLAWMERADLISRIEGPADRRTVGVALTPTGIQPRGTGRGSAAADARHHNPRAMTAGAPTVSVASKGSHSPWQACSLSYRNRCGVIARTTT